jgi:hypothetical protein
VLIGLSFDSQSPWRSSRGSAEEKDHCAQHEDEAVQLEQIAAEQSRQHYLVQSTSKVSG